MKVSEIVPRILKRVEQEAKQEEDKPFSPGVYRASGVGGCPRAIQYAIMGYEAEPIPAQTHLIFKDGHMHHNAVRELLSRIGTLSHIEFGMSKKYEHKGEEFVITGTVDCVLEDIVIDIKSINTFRFKYIDKNFPDDFMNYIYQLQLYMDILRMKKGCILFKDKNTGVLNAKLVPYSEERVNEILDVIVKIQRGYEEHKFIPRPFNRNTWHCKLCQYRIHCWKLPMERRG